LKEEKKNNPTGYYAHLMEFQAQAKIDNEWIARTKLSQEHEIGAAAGTHAHHMAMLAGQ